MEGAARIARQIQRGAARRDITILPVLTRVNHTHPANVLAGLRLAQTLFHRLPIRAVSEPERDQYSAEVQVHTWRRTPRGGR